MYQDVGIPERQKVRKQEGHNSDEKYTITPTYLFSLYMYKEEDLCRGDCILHCYVRSSLLFPYFLPFWYPYILIHFECFILLVLYKGGAHVHCYI